MKLFTSDFHLDHKNILQYSHRPYPSVVEMAGMFIHNTNKLINKGDILYFLGDWSLNKSAVPLISKINCPVHFIFGNHDKSNRKLITSLDNVVSYGDIIETHIGPEKTSVTLCHYAMITFNKSHHGALNIHGHSHGDLQESYNRLDVGIDNAAKLLGEYRPFTEAEVLSQISRINELYTPMILDSHHPQR